MEVARRRDQLRRAPIACLTTDAMGQIIGANESASALLNMSAKRMEGRLLLHFAQDRDPFTSLMRCVRSEGTAPAKRRRATCERQHGLPG